MPITFEQREDASLVRLEGVIGIASAAELKELLLRTLNVGLAVRIGLESATYLDVTAIQLVWAAAREAGKTGLRMSLYGEVPGVIAAALADAGFERIPIPVEGE